MGKLDPPMDKLPLPTSPPCFQETWEAVMRFNLANCQDLWEAKLLSMDNRDNLQSLRFHQILMDNQQELEEPHFRNLLTPADFLTKPTWEDHKEKPRYFQRKNTKTGESNNSNNSNNSNRPRLINWDSHSCRHLMQPTTKLDLTREPRDRRITQDWFRRTWNWRRKWDSWLKKTNNCRQSCSNSRSEDRT